MVAFVGFPPAAGADGSTGANSRAVAFQSGELGRLTYAATVHNLPLRDLRLWQTLTGGYCPDGDEGDRVDADTPATPIAEPAS